MHDIMKKENNFFSNEEDNNNKFGGRDDDNRKYAAQRYGQEQLSPTEENFLKKMVNDYKREVGGLFISKSRLETFAKQVIPKEKIQEIMKL